MESPCAPRTYNMQAYGYPTPPASPACDHPRCTRPSSPLHQQLQQPQVPFIPRYIPVAPEDRLGRFLEGKLQLTSIAGNGAYGVVYRAVDVKSGARYAVKCLSKFNQDGTPVERRQLAFQSREIQLHFQASAHPNIVSMHKIVDDLDCVYVILEYCPEGDLFFNITECGRYVGLDRLCRSVFLQVLDAVEHCHRLGIFHRDLKPENILVTDKGETLKLADFGLATASDRSEEYGCGSTFYMSPECLDQSSRSPFYMCAPNDVWGLGVILVNLTCGRNPWKQASLEDSTYRAFRHCPGYLKTILPISDELDSILTAIFTPEPASRITLAELRLRIQACEFLTAQTPLLSQDSPASHEQVPVEDESMLVDEAEDICEYDADDEYDSPLSPVSSASDDGSLASSVSTIDDLDVEDFRDAQTHAEMDSVAAAAAKTSKEPQDLYMAPPDVYEPEEWTYYAAHEYVPQHYTGPVSAAPMAPVLVPMEMPPPAMDMQPPPPLPQQCQPRSYFPWDLARFAPVMTQQIPFYHQLVPTFHMGGC